MNKILMGCIAVAGLAAVVLWLSDNDAIAAVMQRDTKPKIVNLKVATEPTQPTTQRIGLNTSFWTSWSSGQYMRNILQNPGFEGRIDRIVAIVQRADDNSFSDGSGLGQNDGFWKGSTFDVRSGSSAGIQGKIGDSLQAGFEGLPQYFVEGSMPNLSENDVVILTKESTPDPVELWWIPQESSKLVKVAKNEGRPDSPGKDSLAMTPDDSQSAEVNSYLDMQGDKFGKLLVCEGPWHFSIWAKADQPAPLRINFGRIGTPSFFVQEIQATTEWQKYDFDFTPNDNGPAGPLKLNLQASAPNTTVYVDDLFLGSAQPENPTSPWRQEVVDIVKKMRPSYLRDWQGQLGDLFVNRIAPAEGRRICIERHYGGNGNANFPYSIPDYFSLCQQVGANPWLIIPTTLSDSELTDFGLFLQNDPVASQFSEIVLEFGNENWNWAFRSGGIPIPAAHGPVADRAFHFIAAAAGPNVPIRKTVNGQFANPWLCNEYVNSAPSADILGVAPYFFAEMTANASDADNLKQLFTVNTENYQKLVEDLQKSQKELALYEVNMHTTGGNATTAERAKFVPAAVGGAALAKHLLISMEYNAKPACIFCLTQIEYGTSDVRGDVSLWGITRDVSPTKRVRPTGLAMTLLNEVVGGSLHKTTPKPTINGQVPVEASKVTTGIFRDAEQWKAAIVSAQDIPVTVKIEFPQDNRALPSTAKVLAAKSPFDNNEESEKVKIEPRAVQATERTVSVDVPPYGFVILTGDE